MRDLLPNGMLGVAIAGLLASFMAGMAANISAFNTVFSYDLWQTYVNKDEPDDYYTRVGRLATVAATLIAIGTAFFAANYSNIMDYLQTLFGFFNAPLFATFILGMFWKRMTADRRLDGPGQRHGWPPSSSACSARTRSARCPSALIGLTGQGASFVAAGAAFVVDIVVSVVVSLVTEPRPESRAAGAGLLADPEDGLPRPGRELAGLVPEADPARRRSSPSSSSSSTSSSGKEPPCPARTTA